MTDNKFMSRLLDSDDDSKWRAAKIIEDLEKQLEEKSRQIHDYIAIIAMIPAFPYNEYVWEGGRDQMYREAADLKPHVQKYLSKVKLLEEKKVA